MKYCFEEVVDRMNYLNLFSNVEPALSTWNKFLQSTFGKCFYTGIFSLFRLKCYINKYTESE